MPVELEVRRVWPENPDPGVGRHLRGDGEGTTVRGEERQAARSGVRRARPDDPDPGVGRHLRGDGEGTILRAHNLTAYYLGSHRFLRGIL